MSNVTSVMINTHSDAISAVVEWFESQYSAIGIISNAKEWAGNKHVQATIWGGAYNYLSLGDFLTAVATAPWSDFDKIGLQVFVKEENDASFAVYAFRKEPGKSAWIFRCVLAAERS